MNAKELFKRAIEEEIEGIRNLGELVEKGKEEQIAEVVKDLIRLDIGKWRGWLYSKLNR